MVNRKRIYWNESKGKMTGLFLDYSLAKKGVFAKAYKTGIIKHTYKTSGVDHNSEKNEKYIYENKWSYLGFRIAAFKYVFTLVFTLAKETRPYVSI